MRFGRSGRAINCLRPQFGPLRDLFLGRIREARLSQAAIDILAIVAYHQPVTAAEIDRLRGKPSGRLSRNLCGAIC